MLDRSVNLARAKNTFQMLPVGLLKECLLLTVVWNVTGIVSYLSKGSQLELLVVGGEFFILILVRRESALAADGTMLKYRSILHQLSLLPRRA